MRKPTLDADTILKRAAPVTGQHAHEIQPFGENSHVRDDYSDTLLDISQFISQSESVVLDRKFASARIIQMNSPSRIEPFRPPSGGGLCTSRSWW
jgi:hypothetical protein